MNNKQTPIEKLLATPWRMIEEHNEEFPDNKIKESNVNFSSPTRYTDAQHTNAHYHTVVKMGEQMEVTWNEEEQNYAETWMRALLNDFYEPIFGAAFSKHQEQKNNVTAATFPYDEMIQDLTSKYLLKGDKNRNIKPWVDMTDGERKASTFIFFKGVPKERTRMLGNARAKAQADQRKIEAAEKKLKTAKEKDNDKQIKFLEEKLSILYKNLASRSTTVEFYKQRAWDVKTWIPARLMDKDVLLWYRREYTDHLMAVEDKPLQIGKHLKGRGGYQLLLDELIKDC